MTVILVKSLTSTVSRVTFTQENPLAVATLKIKCTIYIKCHSCNNYSDAKSCPLLYLLCCMYFIRLSLFLHIEESEMIQCNSNFFIILVSLYQMFLKSIETEAVFTKAEMNNVRNINFLQNGFLGIQRTSNFLLLTLELFFWHCGNLYCHISFNILWYPQILPLRWIFI